VGLLEFYFQLLDPLFLTANFPIEPLPDSMS
jgi:hypothetical protein